MSFRPENQFDPTAPNDKLPPTSLPMVNGQAGDRPNPRCCSGISRFFMPAMVMVTVLAIATAAYFAGAASSVRNQPAEGGASTFNLPLLHANSAVTSEKFSIATGSISAESDGLFVLDHNSGLLQCSVIYPRLGRFMGQFTVNVGETLGTGGKGGSYLLVTGRVDFPTASNNPVGQTVVYVMDTATGNYASYYVPFNRQMMTSGRAQQDVLKLITTGSANPVIDRDALR